MTCCSTEHSCASIRPRRAESAIQRIHTIFIKQFYNKSCGSLRSPFLLLGLGALRAIEPLVVLRIEGRSGSFTALDPGDRFFSGRAIVTVTSNLLLVARFALLPRPS